MEQRTFNWYGTKQSYTVYENPGAPSIILIHGFGEDGEIWNGQVGELNKHYRLLVPDLSGSGRSAYHARLMDIDEMAETIYELVQMEQIEKPILFGHSMGGYITLAYAEKYPLRAIGLVHSTAYADSAEKVAARQKSIVFIRENGAKKFLLQTIPNLFSKNYVQQHKDKVDVLLEKAGLFAPETLIGYYEAMIRRPDRCAVLKKAKMPVFFAAGVWDEAVPYRHTLQQSYLANLSYIHILENSAHMGMLEEKESLDTAMNKFLNRISYL
jgi:pimeloyl-ACP methyl ester carboxylesterase